MDFKRNKNNVMEVGSEKTKSSLLGFLKNVEKYKKQLSVLDKQASAGNKNLKSMEKKFFSITDNILAKGHSLEQRLKSRLILKNAKENFRRLVGPLLYKGKFFDWGYRKPAGYPGDYKIIEWLYGSKPISKGLGYCMDMYALKDGYALAVRSRKDKMREILSNFINSHGNKNAKIRILNLGCGSCKEIRELPFVCKPKCNTTFYFIDQDKKALEFSKGELNNLNLDNSKFIFMQRNVISLCTEGVSAENSIPKQDMVYSIGLADYIPDLYLEKLISFSFNSLKKRGEFIFAHKNVPAYPSLVSYWICDWNFIPRTRQHLLALIKNALRGKDYKIRLQTISDGRIYFVHIKRN